MTDGENSVQARNQIPDSWGSAGHCPACEAVSLQVIHLPDSPDYLICGKCEFSFEVSANGSQIRVKNLAENLEFAEERLRFRWVTPGAIRKLLENRSALIQQKTVPENKKTLSDDDVWERALSFHRLGNKPKKIAYILIQAGATHEQAEAALKRLQEWIEQDTKRQSQKLLWVGGIASLLIILGFAVWFVALGRISDRLDAGIASPAQDSQPVIPLKSVAEVLPDAVKPEFLKSDPIKVINSGPANSRCPSSAQQAEALFGGQEGAWQKASQPGAWQMMHTGEPATVRVPAGMVAGYIDNTTFMFLSANGPATIQNVNFIVIACE